MNAIVTSDRKICVWRSGEKKFSVSLDFLVGIATLKRILQPGQTEVAGADLAGLNLDFVNIKIVEDLSDPTVSSTFIKLLVLQHKDYLVGTKIDELLFYGEETKWPPSENKDIFLVTEKHILELGLKGEKPETPLGAQNEENSSKVKNFIFFKLGQTNYAIDVDDVDEVISVRQAVEFRLVSNQALGYFHSKGETIPVVSIGGADLKCEKIIVTKQNNLKFGFPVNAITNLIRDFDCASSSDSTTNISYNGEQWSAFDPTAALQGVKLKEISLGYENIFSKSERLLESKKDSVLKSLVLMDIGERVCISANLIRKVEAIQTAFDPAANTYVFNDVAIPLIDARKHYGLNKSADKKTVERILILEKDGILVSVLVSSVDAIVYIDEKSILPYGEWVFSDSNANFKKDVSGMINVLDYQHTGKLNLINISFETIFNKAKAA